VQRRQGHPLIRFSQAEEHPGFTDALLDILQAEQEAPVRLSGKQGLDLMSSLSSLPLTRCSGCLPQEPRHEGVGTQRGHSAT
jgi:hypothetical protein